MKITIDLFVWVRIFDFGTGYSNFRFIKLTHIAKKDVEMEQVRMFGTCKYGYYMGQSVIYDEEGNPFIREVYK